MQKILTMILLTNIGVWADFSKSGNIVIDSVTKLQWQDDAIGEQMNWEKAIEHCEGLNLDGYSDWRLPNINELKSLVDRTKYNPAIVSGFDNINSSGSYWSSTTNKSYSSTAWIVYFSKGVVTLYPGSFYPFVRCVRAGE